MTLFARLLVVAAAVPFAFANYGSNYGGSYGSSSSKSCSSSEFYWSGKECCLPHGGYSNPPSPPKGSSCPSSWQWHNEKSCCIPTSPPSTSTPSCSSGWGWDSNKNCCQPHSPTTTAHTTAHTTTVHTTSVHTTSVHTTSAPPATTSSSCPSNQWYWGDKNCCLPHGGSPNPPSPPKGSGCPSNWEWNTGKNCCVPHHPDQPPPQCSSGWGWDNGSKCCFPHSTTTTKSSQPSGKPYSGNSGYGGSWGNSGYGNHNSGHWKRSHGKARAESLCPNGMEACPLSKSGLSDDFQCFDTRTDLESCGGCASTGAGQDCTAIEGAWNVGCKEGVCVVYTCAAGYLKSADNKACVKV